MDISSYFSSYLTSGDFPEPRVLTIDSVRIEKLGQGEEEKEKPIVFFHESEKGIVLGRTTASQIAQIVGAKDTDHWTGKKVEAFNDVSVSFRGKIGGIRFRPAPLSAEETAF